MSSVYFKFHLSPLVFLHLSIDTSTEVQHDRSTNSQPAGGVEILLRSRPSPEWGPGPDVDGGQD